ncbi:disease resistance protein RPP13-like [Eucalyptus grandis]|uniref:disease resistance protein RPP13-like n=1 Tax=Eucalyptus grandis TaxID=71139 RepID=UPI00192EBF6C|nr:disease resistance protein RPP13-like [Eucalyptus grandis]
MNILRPENNMKAGSDIVGRKGFVDKLVAQLIHDGSSELRVISVLGERAIGKTALVRSVYNRLDINRRFKHRAWVHILAGSGLKDILFDVLRQTTMRELEEVYRHQEQHLSKMLKKTLKKKRYLVVLDNLQSVDLMKMLLISFANSRNGSRVIITTCNDNMSLDSGPMHFGHLESCRLSKEEGREQSKLVAQLIPAADESSELRVISVLGERATGKTALVESVYDKRQIQCHFNRHAWVRVFADSGLEDILSDVLRQPTMPKLEEVDCQREQHLSEIFQKTFKEQRFLVVLDNLQSVDLMKMLLISFGDSRNGSRVIITTSNEKMSLDSRHIHFSHLKLCPLSEEESHSLLGKSGWTRDPELTKAILDKCNGYPPVIQLLGGLPSTFEVPNYCTLTEIISLSYDSLLTFSRDCLLYLVLFPRESEIPVRRLFNIWLAEKPSSSGDCTKDALDELVARNMVHVVTRKLDGSAKTCLMPGFLHDFMSVMVMDVGTSEISHNSISTSSRPPRMSPIAVKIYPSATGEQEMMVSTNTSTEPRGARRANMSSLSLHSTKLLSCSPPKLEYIAIKMDGENRQRKQMWISHDAKTQYVAKFFRSFMLFNTWKQWEHVKETEMFLEPLRLRDASLG